MSINLETDSITTDTNFEEDIFEKQNIDEFKLSIENNTTEEENNFEKHLDNVSLDEPPTLEELFNTEIIETFGDAIATVATLILGPAAFIPATMASFIVRETADTIQAFANHTQNQRGEDTSIIWSLGRALTGNDVNWAQLAADTLGDLGKSATDAFGFKFAGSLISKTSTVTHAASHIQNITGNLINRIGGGMAFQAFSEGGRIADNIINSGYNGFDSNELNALRTQIFAAPSAIMFSGLSSGMALFPDSLIMNRTGNLIANMVIDIPTNIADNMVQSFINEDNITFEDIVFNVGMNAVLSGILNTKIGQLSGSINLENINTNNVSFAMEGGQILSPNGQGNTASPPKVHKIDITDADTGAPIIDPEIYVDNNFLISSDHGVRGADIFALHGSEEVARIHFSRNAHSIEASPIRVSAGEETANIRSQIANVTAVRMFDEMTETTLMYLGSFYEVRLSHLPIRDITQIYASQFGIASSQEAASWPTQTNVEGLKQFMIERIMRGKRPINNEQILSLPSILPYSHALAHNGMQFKPDLPVRFEYSSISGHHAYYDKDTDYDFDRILILGDAENNLYIRIPIGI